MENRNQPEAAAISNSTRSGTRPTDQCEIKLLLLWMIEFVVVSKRGARSQRAKARDAACQKDTAHEDSFFGGPPRRASVHAELRRNHREGGIAAGELEPCRSADARARRTHVDAAPTVVYDFSLISASAVARSGATRGQVGLWLPRDQRPRKAHQPRHRRECLGELVQIDGCEHAWFEERGPVCSLLVYVDDATGRLMELRFVEVESAFDYFASTSGYLRRHGKPVAFDSDARNDRHGLLLER